MAAPRRPVSRPPASVLRAGLVLVTVLLLTGCRGTSGAPGGYGAAGDDGTVDMHVVHGGDGANGNGGDGNGADGANGNGGSRGADGTAGAAGADGTAGADGVNGADGADGADGSSGLTYSASGPGSVTGSGHLTSRQVPLSGVSALVAGAGFVVHVRIGEPEQATIRMDDNLTEQVDATVAGDELRLGLKPGAHVRNATLSAEVTVRQLDRLTARDAGQVTLASQLTGQALQVEASGASQIVGAVSVAQVKVAASGASAVTLAGRADHLQLRGAGTSALRLPGLAVRDLDVALVGASHATVAVSDTLAARTSGVSTLRCSGTPRITRAQSTGVSSIDAQ